MQELLQSAGHDAPNLAVVALRASMHRNNWPAAQTVVDVLIEMFTKGQICLEELSSIQHRIQGSDSSNQMLIVLGVFAMTLSYFSGGLMR